MMKTRAVFNEPKPRSPIRANHNVPGFDARRTLGRQERDNRATIFLPKAFARRNGTYAADGLSALSPRPAYNLRPKGVAETSTLLEHFPRITSTGATFARECANIRCACCSLPSSPLKEATIPADAFSSSTLIQAKNNASSQNLTAVCSVPMLSPSIYQTSLPLYSPACVQSAQTQTSPPSSKRGRKRRHSGGHLVTSLKKKIGDLRRSLSSDRTRARSKAPSVEKRSQVLRSLSTNRNPPVKVNFVEKCDDGAYLIQFQRNATTQPFGLFLNLDANGFFISRLAQDHHLRVCHEYLHVNDRILAVQGVPSELLSLEGVRGLLQGCYVVTIKVLPLSKPC